MGTLSFRDGNDRRSPFGAFPVISGVCWLARIVFILEISWIAGKIVMPAGKMRRSCHEVEHKERNKRESY